MSAGELPTPNGGTRPVPDPTTLTDAAIDRSVAALTQYIDGEIKVLNARLAASDDATKLRLQAIDNVPDLITKYVSHLELLHDEKFRSIATQFQERDTRSERESRDNKLAVDAAFAAQEKQAAAQNKSNAEAIGKSEVATSDTIAKLSQLFGSTTDALRDQIGDLKDRTGRMEATKVGAVENRTGIYATAGIVVSLLIMGLAVITFVIARVTP